MKWGRWYSNKILSDYEAQVDSRMTYWLPDSGVNRTNYGVKEVVL